ncbi:hypothetical protein BJX96DRAFT_186418 [Aspergillus floccosus]
MVGSCPSSPSKSTVEDCQKMDSQKPDMPANRGKTICDLANLRRSPRLNKDPGDEKAYDVEKRREEVMKNLEQCREVWGGKPANFPTLPITDEDLKPPPPVMDLEKCSLRLASMSDHDRAIILGHEPGSNIYRQIVNPTVEDHEELYEEWLAGRGPLYLYGMGGVFKPLITNEIDQYLGSIEIFIDQFVELYMIKDNKIIDERLTGEQRVRSSEVWTVGGWAYQGTWEEVVKLLHPTTAELLPEIIVRTMIAKRLYGDVLMDPWLDDEGGQVATQRPCDKLFYPSYTEVTNMFHWFKRGTSPDID